MDVLKDKGNEGIDGNAGSCEEDGADKRLFVLLILSLSAFETKLGSGVILSVADDELGKGKGEIVC